MLELFAIRNKKIKIVLLIMIIIVFVYLLNKKENYAGALIQLYSKGPQDYYLTGDYPYTYYYGYGYGYRRYPYRRHPYVWNMPTRFRRNDAPYLMLTPDRYYLY